MTTTDWKVPAQLKAILQQTKQNRANLLRVLQDLDKDKVKALAFSIFQQAAGDNNIFFDERSTNYIVQKRCDGNGLLKYLEIIKDMVIKTYPDYTGTLMAQWHIKQALEERDPNSVASINSDHVSKPPISKTLSRRLFKSETKSKTSKSSAIEDVQGEMEAAIRKVLIKKPSNIEEATKLLNLNSVSAACQILNLKKNDYH